jgi:inorganic pyrophosphatase
MKRIKHNDLTHYFLRPHQELPQAYLDSCEKFFRELKNLKLARLTATNVQKKRQASSTKRQASSLTAAGPCDSNRIIKENLK